MKIIPDRTHRIGPKKRVELLFAAVFGFLLAIPAVHAQPPQDEPTRNQFLDDEAQETPTRISRRDASEIAKETFQGRVLSVRLEEDHWRIRMDQEGNVFNVFVDANSGRVSRPTE